MVKCIQCNGKLFRSYVRQNPNGRIHRKWTTIGFYCLKCKINFTDKEIIKIKKNLTKKSMKVRKTKKIQK